MGPIENPTNPAEKQAVRRRRRPARRPRMRRCLLKKCEQRFHPRQARQRYCSERCREAARKWSQWRAQQRYRGTTAGKQKRNGQSRRHRERARSRKPPEPEAVSEPARDIATGQAATRHSRASGVVPCNASARTRAGMHWHASRSGSGVGNRRGFNPEILIQWRRLPYIQPV
jgi:hypothetical protein